MADGLGHIRIRQLDGPLQKFGLQFPVDAPAAELWVPLSVDLEGRDQRGDRMLDALGRLKPGVSPQEAQAQMDLVAAALAQQYPDSNTNHAKTLVWPEQERVAGRSVRALLILLGAVGTLLVIACANVGNLLLARNAQRAQDFALRAALGASRPAIVRQVLIEGFALGFRYSRSRPKWSVSSWS